MRREVWILASAALLPACPVDERALASGGAGLVAPVVGGAAGLGAAGDEGATAGEPGAGAGGPGGSDPVGVGTAGADTSGPCDGEGCSCEGLGSKACARQSCCASLNLPGGDFTLGDGNAAVAPFRLDEFEVTVGRFRRFVAGYLRPPAPDSGQHDYVIGSGWMPEWSQTMPENREDLAARLACDGQTWTDAEADHENLPMNCVTWFEAFAFCAWDGGRLPTEAEWEYAAAGGDEGRAYPWGDEAPDTSRAVYACDGGSTCADSALAAVGSKAAGAARYGQLDLAGSLAEWTLDYFGPYEERCDHCANIGNGTERVTRGGDLTSSAADLASSRRAAVAPETRDFTHGFRCARRP